MCIKEEERACDWKFKKMEEMEQSQGKQSQS